MRILQSKLAKPVACTTQAIFKRRVKDQILSFSRKVKLKMVKEIEILTADDTELIRISQEGTLSLNLNEMQTIQTHFGTLGRNPTDVEIETIAQTWSEHCVHKTFKSTILYSEEEKHQADRRFVSNLHPNVREEIANRGVSLSFQTTPVSSTLRKIQSRSK